VAGIITLLSVFDPQRFRNNNLHSSPPSWVVIGMKFEFDEAYNYFFRVKEKWNIILFKGGASCAKMLVLLYYLTPVASFLSVKPGILG